MLKKLTGRPTAIIEDVPASAVKAYNLLKSGKINKSNCARISDISSYCFNKYIRIIEERTS